MARLFYQLLGGEAGAAVLVEKFHYLVALSGVVVVYRHERLTSAKLILIFNFIL